MVWVLPDDLLVFFPGFLPESSLILSMAFPNCLSINNCFSGAEILGY
jgi:hypothetical protein